jgi:hypothetical protein
LNVDRNTRYFFYATSYRAQREEYNLEGEDGQVASGADSTDTEFKVPEVPDDKGEELENTEQPGIDSALADWFKVEQDETPNAGVPAHETSDTETENDSDHDDPRLDEDDEWLKVKPGPDLAINVEKVCGSSILFPLLLTSRGSCQRALRLKPRYIRFVIAFFWLLSYSSSTNHLWTSEWARVMLLWNTMKTSSSNICMFRLLAYATFTQRAVGTST